MSAASSAEPRGLKRLLVWTVVAWVVACTVGALASSQAFQEWLNGDEEDLRVGDFFKALFAPELAFALGAGLIAIVTFYVLIDKSDSLRMPIAATITVVFFAFLLFPEVFSQSTPLQFRAEFIDAWKTVIAFYFVSEAAVQVTKVVQERKERADRGGTTEMPPADTTPPSEVPGDVKNLSL